MKCILIVDDEPNVSRVTRHCLEKAGYQVEIAPNGVEALERLEWREFDAMISDIMMPRMTGQELCRQVRERMSDRKMPIIIMSSSIEAEHRTWAQELGATIFLEKPVSLRVLVEELRKVFEEQDKVEGEEA